MGLLRRFISSKYFSISFYCIWFLIAVFQANYTDLLNDEAYYWKYSQFLSWGYFDHPPMVALLIKFGTLFFNGELGVRFIFTILGTATIYITQLILKPKNKVLFFTLISSIAFLHFISFLALPDIPFLFFTSLFFYLLQNYLTSNSITNAVLLGLTIACILLSKYHAFILIVIALLTNIKLTKRPNFYLIILLSLILVLPHFLWQLEHDFPSIQYHFHDRNLSGYSILNTVNFLLTQLILFGPFVGIILWIGFFKSTTKNKFEETLYWQIIGTCIFFFLLTFNGSVQGHWTSTILIPLIYFGYNYLQTHSKLKRITYYQFPVAFILIISVKLAIASPYSISEKIDKSLKNFKGKQKWAETVCNVSKCVPVVFMNSYQNAAIYEFYTNCPAITISNIMSRKNQYDLWQYEDSIRGQSVVILPNYYINNLDTIPGLTPTTQFTTISNFQHYGQVKLEATNWKNNRNTYEPFVIQLNLINEDNFTFLENPNFTSEIMYVYFKENVFISAKKTGVKLHKIKNNNTEITIIPPAEPGIYQVYFSIKTGWLPPSLTSNVYKLNIY